MRCDVLPENPNHSAKLTATSTKLAGYSPNADVHIPQASLRKQWILATFLSEMFPGRTSHRILIELRPDVFMVPTQAKISAWNGVEIHRLR